MAVDVTRFQSIANNDVTAPGVDYKSSPTLDTDYGPFRGFYVAAAGNVAIRSVNGVDVTFAGVVAGSYYPFAGTRINTSGTTVANSNIVLLF